MQLSVVAANVAANAVCAQLNNGYCRVFTAPRPASTEVGLTSQLLLAEPRFGVVAFAPASGGIALSNTLLEDTSTPHGGVATWFRLYKADGVTVIADGSVGIGDLDVNTDDGFDMELADTTIDANRRFAVTQVRYVHPRV